ALPVGWGVGRATAAKGGGAAVAIGDAAAAFPFSVLAEERVVQYTVGGQDLVVFFKPGTRSALDDLLIGNSDEVGATGVFDINLEGQGAPAQRSNLCCHVVGLLGIFVDNGEVCAFL
ncbi:MAG: DUF3179 domain-containing protein, partial [Deltaproteobacteria bacterium]|nr:DUF3179 domain-containing protein [Deltaproteobacteria bacterium]